MLTNLIDNAVKHAFDGLDTGSIQISATTPDKNSVLLTITDNGKGMEADVVEKIFDPFFTTKMGQGGTGLGMHVTYNAIVSILGGAITVDSQAGKGSTFQLELPLIGPKTNTG